MRGSARLFGKRWKAIKPPVMQTVLDSLSSALQHAMASDGRVILLGEDILDPYGGAFKVTRGLSVDFPDRVLATPISEAGFVGLAAGMALRGLRPVVEIMFGDFLTLATDALVNHITKFRWMYNNQVNLPLVIRTPMGGRRGYGPTHSQTLEKHYLGVPGLTVLAPCNLAGGSGNNAGDLLTWAILKQQDPVLFIENKAQYLLPLLDETSLNEFTVKQTPILPDQNPDGPQTLSLEIKSAPLPALTLVAYGYMAELARQAQLDLAYQFEIFTELVIPTQLAPYNLKQVLESVRRTKRLLVVEEGARTLGWGAEVVAQVSEEQGLEMKMVRRLAAQDLPVPASIMLERQVLPGVADIIHQAKMMV
jgi:pyruvate/2-oxoglutarate/acetoin dehydrogenase E1 component